MVHHQDVAVYRRVSSVPGQRAGKRRVIVKWHTKVYDKSETFAAAGVDFVYYPHVTSLLSMQCKYGIILSQSYRFVRRCSVIHDFFYSVAKLIHYMVSTKSYVYEDCFEVYRGFCKKRLGIYGKFKIQQLVRPVELAVQRMLGQ